MKYLAHFLILFAVTLLLRSVYSSPCQRSEHCSDGDSSTLDYCTPQGRCLNIGTSTRSSFVRITRADVISLTNRNPLSVSEKLRVVRAASLIYGQFNPHRLLHLNYYHVDPVKDLETLELLLKSPKFRLQTNLEFHNAMTEICSKMNDFHSVYSAPPPLSQMLAHVPPTIALFYERNSAKRRYVLKDINEADVPPGAKSFKPGVEIVSYNGVPIDRAVLRIGRQGYAANTGARVLNGISGLTQISLGSSFLPESDSVVIGYKTKSGALKKVTFVWSFFAQTPSSGENASSMSIENMDAPPADADDEMHDAHLRRLMHMKPIRELGWMPKEVRLRRTTKKVNVSEEFQDFLAGEIIETSKGSIGRMHVKSFNTFNTHGMYLEYVKVLQEMPSTGLVIDIENNPGGNTELTKILLDLISPNNTIQFVSPTSIRVSNFTGAFLSSLMKRGRKPGDKMSNALRRYFLNFISSYRTSRATGQELTSAGQRISSIDSRIPRVYDGPVVTLNSAGTYSSGDIFSALSFDSGLTTVVGVSESTGAGGASTLSYELIQQAVPDLLDELPPGIGFGTAFARFYRTGPKAGAIIESFGIRPQVRYYRSKKDVLEDDCELYEFLAELLEKKREE